MDVEFAIVDEQVAPLEALGIEEGCTTTTSSSSLDVSAVEFE